MTTDTLDVTFIRRQRRRVAPCCPVDGCTRTRPSGMVTCRRCWDVLPPDLRRRVFVDWSALESARDAKQLDPSIDQQVIDNLRARYNTTRGEALAAAKDDADGSGPSSVSPDGATGGAAGSAADAARSTETPAVASSGSLRLIAGGR